MKRLLCGVVLAGMASAVNLGAAPRRSSPSYIVLNTPSGTAGSAAAATTWEPRLNDYVSFTSSYPSSLDPQSVAIQIVCYQNGSIVFATAGLADRSFLLGGTESPWKTYGGAATCRADLYYWSTNGVRMNIIASTEFDSPGW